MTVTGGSGFLGVTLATAIFETGGDVVCMDIAATPTAPTWSDS